MDVQRDDIVATKMGLPIPEWTRLEKKNLKMGTVQYLDQLSIQLSPGLAWTPNKIQVWVRVHGFQTQVPDAATMYCILYMYLIYSIYYICI